VVPADEEQPRCRLVHYNNSIFSKFILSTSSCDAVVCRVFVTKLYSYDRLYHCNLQQQLVSAVLLPLLLLLLQLLLLLACHSFAHAPPVVHALHTVVVVVILNVIQDVR
jgi:hypothetical protein